MRLLLCCLTQVHGHPCPPPWNRGLVGGAVEVTSDAGQHDRGCICKVSINLILRLALAQSAILKIWIIMLGLGLALAYGILRCQPRVAAVPHLSIAGSPSTQFAL
jgi:hypothetical protein